MVDKATSSLKVPSVTELANTSLAKFKVWLSSVEGKTNIAKIRNVLIEAVSIGRCDICQAVMDSGRVANDVIAQMLPIACLDGHLSVAQLIVNRGYASTSYLYVSLIEASTQGQVVIVLWLLDAIKLSYEDSTRWLLATASGNGHMFYVQMFAAPSDMQAVSQALRTACWHGRVNVVGWLTKYTTADASLSGTLDILIGPMTSLTAACYKSQSAIVKTLLQCVTPHTVNIQSGKLADSALHLIMSSVVYYDKSKWNGLLHSACDRGNIDEVSTVLHVQNINVTDHSGNTPLHLACRNGNLDIVQMLMSVFASIDITDHDRRTALDTAKHLGNNELVPYMSQLLDASNYTASSVLQTGVTTPASGHTVNTVTENNSTPVPDVIVSDVSIVLSDQQTTQMLHRNGNNRLKAAANNKRHFKFV